MYLLRKLSKIASFIATYIAMCMLSCMTVIIFTLVITRYFLSYSMPWAEELTRYLMVWMALLSSAALIQLESHLKFDILITKLPCIYQDVLSLLLYFFEAGFLIILIKMGWNYVQSVKIITCPTLGISLAWPSLAIPTTAILMLFFTGIRIIEKIANMRVKSTDKKTILG